jgi:CelD/BcsL family acetyltransferase involved in cellulose biosynthesis
VVDLIEITASPGLASSVTIETVTTTQGVESLRPSYEQLQRTTGNILPFATHDWHVAWCRHILNSNPRILDQPNFFVVRNLSGECVAILPFIVSRRRVGRFKIAAVNMLGADPHLTEIRAPLMVSGYENSIAAAVQPLLARIEGWDWVHWTGSSAAFGAALSTHGTLIWEPVLKDFVLDLPPTWDEFRKGLKRNIRESLRHCYNSLKRDNHSFEFRVVENGPDVAAGVARFFDLHLMRAEMTRGEHPDRFSTPIFRDFLQEICRRFADRGALRLFQLKIGGKIVATWVGFVAADSIYFYNSGFDPAWARYSVMTTTVAEAIKYAIGQGFKSINLSADEDVSKTRWSPRQVEYLSAYQLGTRLRSRLALQTYLRARSDQGPLAWLLQRVVQAHRNWD